MDDGARSAAPNQKRPLPPDVELVELLWRNGAVAARSQAQAHHQPAFGRGLSGDGGNTGASGVTGDPAAAWHPCGGALDGDMHSQLWHGRVGGGTAASVRPAVRGGAGSSRAGGEVASSFCGSNLVAAAAPALRVDDDIDDAALFSPRGKSGARAGGSTSAGSGSADLEVVGKTRPSKRRTRAAEVHNQSERRRRDRINEKMRALQELVPHCNKTDKASILDEAIEYLKSLQLQVQIMWMTTGTAPMMLPGAHPLMSPMSMGFNTPCMPAAQCLSQMQGVPPYLNNPLPNQMPQISSPVTNVPNVSSQLHNDHIGRPGNLFLHLHDALAGTPQLPSLFGYGSQMAQQNEIQELLAGAATPAFGAASPSSSDGTGT